VDKSPAEALNSLGEDPSFAICNFTVPGTVADCSLHTTPLQILYSNANVHFINK